MEVQEVLEVQGSPGSAIELVPADCAADRLSLSLTGNFGNFR